MGFNIGLIAGVFYAKQMGAQPNSRLKKHYEKCRNRNHKKSAISMYSWRLGHLIFMAALIYLQYLLYEIASHPTNRQADTAATQSSFQNSSVLAGTAHSLHLRVTPLVPSGSTPTTPQGKSILGSIGLLQLLIGSLALWMLSEAQFRIIVIDRKKIIVRHYQLFQNSQQSYPTQLVTKVDIVRKGQSKFTSQTQCYTLRLRNQLNFRLDISTSLSSFVIKRKYLEVCTFLGWEVDVDKLNSLIVDDRAKR